MFQTTQLTPSPFFANGTENAHDWLAYFVMYVAFKNSYPNTQTGEPGAIRTAYARGRQYVVLGAQ